MSADALLSRVLQIDGTELDDHALPRTGCAEAPVWDDHPRRQ